MKKKKIILVVVAIAIITAIVLRLTVFRREFLYAGTIEATKIDIPARVASVIAAYEVEEGQRVAAKQPLVRLSCEDIRLAAQSAQTDFQRAERLFKTGSMPKEAYEHLKTKHDDVALKLAWCTVESPKPGTILNTYREAAEWVNPGARLLTLADLSEVWTILYVEQPMLTKVQLGQSVKGYLADLDMKEFTGKITHISDEAEFTPKNVQTREERTRLVFAIKVTFPNPEGLLKPGMPIEVKLPE